MYLIGHVFADYIDAAFIILRNNSLGSKVFLGSLRCFDMP